MLIDIKNRHDVAIKYLFAVHFLTSSFSFEYYKALYKKHIELMTWGIEDHKRTVEHFVQQYCALLIDIQKNWYNQDFPIPINNKGELLNWAHRYAACRATHTQPYITKNNSVRGIQRTTNSDKSLWDQDERITILQGIAMLYPTSDILIIRPALYASWDEIKMHIDNNYSIVWQTKIELNLTQFRELIYDIYAYDDLYAGSVGINQKIDLLTRYDTSCIIVLTQKVIHKEALREYCLPYISKKMDQEMRPYLSFHNGVWSWEREYLKKILLNRTNIQHLLIRNVWRKNNKKYYNELTQLSQHVNKDEYCIVWSGPMIAIWIDPESDDKDVDIITPSPHHTGIHALSDTIDHLDYTYSKREIQNHELIHNQDAHFWWRGFKFLNIHLLMQEKFLWTRKKDLLHAQQIKSFLDKQSHSTTSSLQTNLSHYISTVIYHSQVAIMRTKIIFFRWARLITKKLGIYDFLSFVWVKYFLRKHIANNRICIITPNFDPYPRCGGIVEQTKLLSKEFQKQWKEVEIYTYKHDTSRDNEEDSPYWKIKRYTSMIHLLVLLLRSSYKYDLIISNTVFRHSLVLSLLKTCKTIFCNTVICFHSWGDTDEIVRLKNKINNPFFKKIYFGLLAQNTYLKCLNKDNEHHLLEIYWNKSIRWSIVTFYNWINFEIEHEPQHILKKTNNNKRQLLYIWRIVPEKWIFDIIDVTKDMKGIHLHIAGTSDQQNLQRLHKEIDWYQHITYHGYVQWAEKESLRMLSDIFVLASESEWLPMSVLEAVKYNMPIISTKVGDLYEIFGDSITYTQKNNQQDLKGKIQYVADLVWSASAQHSQHYAHVKEICDISRIAQKYIDLAS